MDDTSRQFHAFLRVREEERWERRSASAGFVVMDVSAIVEHLLTEARINELQRRLDRETDRNESARSIVRKALRRNL